MCSINTAWLSVASSVAAMVVPAAHGARQGTELVAVSLAALFTVVGEAGQLTTLSVPRPVKWTGDCSAVAGRACFLDFMVQCVACRHDGDDQGEGRGVRTDAGVVAGGSLRRPGVSPLC